MNLRLLLVALTATAAVLTAPPAQAGHSEGGATRSPGFLEIFFYGTSEVQAFVGGPVDADACDEISDVAVTRVVRQLRDGTVSVRYRTQAPVYLYRTEQPAPVFLAEQCAAIADGADAPEPWAVGTVRVRSSASPLATPDGPPLPGTHIVNTSRGFATTTEGQRLRVTAQADVYLDEDLDAVGDPAEFQSLTLTPVGPR